MKICSFACETYRRKTFCEMSLYILHTALKISYHSFVMQSTIVVRFVLYIFSFHNSEHWLGNCLTEKYDKNISDGVAYFASLVSRRDLWSKIPTVLGHSSVPYYCYNLWFFVLGKGKTVKCQQRVKWIQEIEQYYKLLPIYFMCFMLTHLCLDADFIVCISMSTCICSSEEVKNSVIAI